MKPVLGIIDESVSPPCGRTATLQLWAQEWLDEIRPLVSNRFIDIYMIPTQ